MQEYGGVSQVINITGSNPVVATWRDSSGIWRGGIRHQHHGFESGGRNFVLTTIFIDPKLWEDTFGVITRIFDKKLFRLRHLEKFL